MTQSSANLQFDITSHCMQCASAETEALYAVIYSKSLIQGQALQQTYQEIIHTCTDIKMRANHVMYRTGETNFSDNSVLQDYRQTMFINFAYQHTVRFSM